MDKTEAAGITFIGSLLGFVVALVVISLLSQYTSIYDGEFGGRAAACHLFMFILGGTISGLLVAAARTLR